MPESTVRKNLKSLINKGYVEIKEVKDDITGLITK
jgi:DNA-binding MarR family transcriptional regulator